LHRTFTSFELLIVDDGSTDATPALIESFTDPRLVVIRNDTALGVARSLNLGLHAARGEYIARLDADDLCQPERLTTQITFFERAPDAGAVGTGYVKIDSAGRSLGPRPAPTDPIDVRWGLLFHNPLVHSTMTIRKSAFDAVGGFFEAESGEDPIPDCGGLRDVVQDREAHADWDAPGRPRAQARARGVDQPDVEMAHLRLRECRPFSALRVAGAAFRV
jgi:glycosyltransferase involved in cell wall biosynthesis